MRMKIISLVFLFSVISLVSVGQKVKITGTVLDSKTHQPLSFVSVYCKKALVGDNTDDSGRFSMLVPQQADTIIFSEIGFEKFKYPYITPPTNPVDITLEASELSLKETKITGYKDPGRHVIRMIIENKKQNDVERFTKESNKEYNNLKIELGKLTPSQKRSFFNNIAKIYSSALNDSSNTSAPIFMSEKYFLNFHSVVNGIDNDVKTKIAQKDLGLATDKISQKFDRFMVRLNPYNGIVPILKTTFISPTSEIGLGYYKYRIEDTIQIGNKEIVRVRFKPNNEMQNTFEGIVYTELGSWGIQHIEMASSPNININYINKINITQDYEYVPAPLSDDKKDSVWVLKRNASMLELKNGLDLLNLPFKTDSLNKTLYIKSKSVYESYILNDKNSTAENYLTNYKEDPAYLVKGTQPEFKESYRLEPLSKEEVAIYKMADSLKHDKSFVRTTKFASFVATGQWDVGNFKLGNLTSLLSKNGIEGIRTRLNVWSTESLSQRFNVNGFMAYGFKDKKIKGGIGIKYVPSRSPYTKTEFYYRKDYNSIVLDDDELDNDNIFTLILHKPIPTLQELSETFKLMQEYDITHSLSTKISASYRNIDPSFNYKYFNTEDPTHFLPDTTNTLHSISDAQIGITFRYARNEKSLFLNYDKIRFGSTKPIYTLNYTYGFELNSKTPFDYHKVSVGIMQNVNLQPKGTLFYNFNAGKIFGVLPSILLHIPIGNNSYAGNKYAFNNMLPYEYASDMYAQLNCVYNAGGVLFDKLPFIQKFKLRERVIANGYWGSLSKQNQFYNQSYAIKSTQKLPYLEAGVGVGNILSVLYFDCIWRVTERSKTNNISNFGVYAGTKITF